MDNEGDGLVRQQAANWTPNFDEILARQKEEPRPRPPWGHRLYRSWLPAGTYECVVLHAPNEPDKVEFDLQPVMAFSDVDLDAVMQRRETYDRSIRISFWLTPAQKLERFLDYCGIPRRGTVNDRIALAEGRRVGMVIIDVEYQEFDAVARTIPGRRR
jgi:hypothetical protein